MQLRHIEALLGPEVAEVVDVVTHLRSSYGGIDKVQLSATENLEYLVKTSNKRGLYVKLADRVHNMRTINEHRSIAKRRLIAEETLLFFVPPAKKLGLKEVAKELEKRCLEVLSTKK